MPCFLTEAAPRACTRRHSIAMATSCHLALCWLYSKEIEAQVDSNPRRTRNQRRSPGARELQSVAATSPERRTHKKACCSQQEQSNRSYFGHVAPLRYRTHTVGCWWRKAFECEGRMAGAEKPKMNTYQTVSVWAIALRSDRVGAPSALFLPRWRKP